MQFLRAAIVTGVVGVWAGLIPGVADAAQMGKASYYKHGQRTASGERFNAHDYTAAHRTLPFGTRVLVTNLDNGKSVIVRINDRGPIAKGRVIDLSLGAAEVVGLTAKGVTHVKVVALHKVEEGVAAVEAAAPAPVAPQTIVVADKKAPPQKTARTIAEAVASGVGLVLVPPSEPVAGLQ